MADFNIVDNLQPKIKGNYLFTRTICPLGAFWKTVTSFLFLSAFLGEFANRPRVIRLKQQARKVCREVTADKKGSSVQKWWKTINRACTQRKSLGLRKYFLPPDLLFHFGLSARKFTICFGHFQALSLLGAVATMKILT